MIQKKICMLGGFAVGKTSLVSRYVRGIFSDQYLVTLGVKIDRKDVEVDGQKVRMVLWDMAGEDEFAKVNTTYLRGAAGYILVADGTRRASLDLAMVLQRRVTDELGNIPFVTLINKLDLVSEWESSDVDIETLRSSHWDVIKTSARTGEGVDRAFVSLAQKTLKAGPKSE